MAPNVNVTKTIQKEENKEEKETVLPHQDHGYAWVIVFG